MQANTLTADSNADSEHEELILEILNLLQIQTGHDFSRYKRATINRRILRRMQLHRANELKDYLDILRKDEKEIALLFEDLLITVTEFSGILRFLPTLRRTSFRVFSPVKENPAAFGYGRPGAQTEATDRFKKDDAAQRALANSTKLAEIKADCFNAIFFPGGHGPLWDLAENADSQRIIETFMAENLPFAAVCHAPAIFKNTKGADGKSLITGRRVTGFTNTEEDGVGLTEMVPFLIEDMLKSNGGLYEKGPDWDSYVVVDGMLVTGQNPASSTAVAKELLKLIKAKTTTAESAFPHTSK